MLADTKGVGEWGFAALVEADGHRLLFDTGARPGTVLDNARELGVDLAGVRDVVLSHHHGDHTGGLLALRRELSKVNPEALSRCHVGAGIFVSRPGDDGRETNEAVALKGNTRRRADGSWSSAPDGGLPRGLADRPGAPTPPRAELERRDQDPGGGGARGGHRPRGHLAGARHRQGAGPGHRLRPRRSGQHHRLRAGVGPPAPVYALLGGLHLFPADEEALDWTAGKLREAGVAHLLGAHCTGVDAVYGLRRRLGLGRRACVVGAVGSRFDLGGGIDPGTIAR